MIWESEIIIWAASFKNVSRWQILEISLEEQEVLFGKS